MSNCLQGRTHGSDGRALSDGSCTSTTASASTSWAATAEEARTKPSSAGAARFIELTWLLRRRSCSKSAAGSASSSGRTGGAARGTTGRARLRMAGNGKAHRGCARQGARQGSSHHAVHSQERRRALRHHRRRWFFVPGRYVRPGRNFEGIEGGQVVQVGPLHQPMSSRWATLRSRSIRRRDARGTAAPGTTRRTTAWSAGPATSSRIDTTSWSGCAPTESVTPILTRWSGSIGSASPTMATMPAMVAARRPTHFPAEAGSLQEVNEARSTPKEEEEARALLSERRAREDANQQLKEAASEAG